MIDYEEHIDPGCGMTVTPAKAAGSTDYNGSTYYFCSKGCLAKFEAAPESFLTISAEHHDHGHSAHGQVEPSKPQPPNAEEIEYTCPMHPQIVQLGPGTCPICGMALEPKVVSLDTPEDTSEQIGRAHV